MKYCRSCRSFIPSGVEVDRNDPEILNTKVQLGECRRYAPHPVTATGDASEAKALSLWPGVASDSGCAEWDPPFE